MVARTACGQSSGRGAPSQLPLGRAGGWGLTHLGQERGFRISPAEKRAEPQAPPVRGCDPAATGASVGEGKGRALWATRPSQGAGP